MDGRTLLGKTVTFLVICVFMAVFVLLFGTNYVLVGITVATAAMIMLAKDMSVRPVSNLFSVMAFMVMMGVGAFLASIDPYLGLVMNFVTVFCIVFLSMQDLKSPTHFPMLLIYATMVTLPITVEQMPDRLLILAVSSIFIVGLNVLVNHGSRRRSSHRGVERICAEIRRCADEAAAGGSPDIDTLGEMCTEVNRGMYDRLKSHFFTTPRDRRVMDLVVSLMDLGRSVCQTERDPEALRGIVAVMRAVESHEQGLIDASEVSRTIDGFLSSSPAISHTSAIALRDIASELTELESGITGDYGSGRRPKINALIWSLREEARRDSARFTFSVRMALMFALTAFAWEYWAWDGAKILLFTVVAMVVPYLEDSRRMSAMRLSGTLLGVGVFILVAYLAAGNWMALGCVGLAAGYAYVLLDSGRYDRKMFFYTLLVMIVSLMTSPSDNMAEERVLFTLAGIFVAGVANRVVLPYRVSDENMELAVRSLAISRERIRNIRDVVDGREDAEEEAGLSVISASISQKMRLNADRSYDILARKFLIRQDSLSIQCSSLYRSARNMTPECREKVRDIMSVDPDSDVPVPETDVTGLGPYDTDCVRRAEKIIQTYRSNREIMFDLIVAGFTSHGAVPSLRVRNS